MSLLRIKIALSPSEIAPEKLEAVSKPLSEKGTVPERY
jgi:hypothetical protein